MSDLPWSDRVCGVIIDGMTALRTPKQNYINHIALVLDASDSMHSFSDSVVKVADAQIAALADQSKIMDQETRITVYTFNYHYSIECLIYDKDVLRMPSIAGLYKTSGMTALCSATTLAVKDLALTPEKYGEHAFLIYVITDGMENHSYPTDKANLPTLLSTLPDHWTLAAFVPNASAVHYAKSFGFPKDNIAVWDATSKSGFDEVGEVIRQTTSGYMHARARGVRGSKNLFNLNKVSKTDIKKNLTPLTRGSYTINKVDADQRIDDFTRSLTGQYTPGRTFYEMTKRETIQQYKDIALQVDGDVFMGDSARTMLGLTGVGDTRVSPGDHPGYKIFIQSTAHNRKLIGGTQALILR